MRFHGQSNCWGGGSRCAPTQHGEETLGDSQNTVAADDRRLCWLMRVTAAEHLRQYETQTEGNRVKLQRDAVAVTDFEV